jgi:hypothetical protein
MATPDKPIGIALIICDRVITDAATHEKTLVSTFNQIFAPSLPCVHPRMTIFVSVTNGRGTTDTEIKCINESEQSETVFGMKGAIPFTDPNQVVEMSFQFNNVTFVTPGLHCIEFLCSGELILQSRFKVTILKAGEAI